MQSGKLSVKYIIVIVLILIVIVLLGFNAYLLQSKNSSGSVDSSGSQITEEEAASTPVVKNEGTISIPGFESLTLDTGKTKQSISLSNPAENTCLFRISMILENGDVVWTSDLIKPGKSEQIVLKTPLDKGTYSNSKLKYECFTDDEDRTPLNGAETKFILIIK